MIGSKALDVTIVGHRKTFSTRKIESEHQAGWQLAHEVQLLMDYGALCCEPAL